MEALEIFRTESPEQKPEVLEYLQFEGNKISIYSWKFIFNLKMELKTLFQRVITNICTGIWRSNSLIIL